MNTRQFKLYHTNMKRFYFAEEFWYTLVSDDTDSIYITTWIAFMLIDDEYFVKTTILDQVLKLNENGNLIMFSMDINKKYRNKPFSFQCRNHILYDSP